MNKNQLNHLGHLSLSGFDGKIALGNFIGDFIRSRQLPKIPAKIAAGVELHWEIDRYTDRHPNFREGVKRLRPVHQKYAPVVLDIVYDHLLAIHWERYNPECNLIDFAEWVYREFAKQQIEFDKKVQAHIDSLLKYRYLASYGTISGLSGVLSRMDLRTRFPSSFYLATEQLDDHMKSFEAEFFSFMPDMIQFVDLYFNRNLR